jgi:hypothetical protein
VGPLLRNVMRLRPRVRLLLACAALSALSAVLLEWAGLRSAVVLAPQTAAPEPYGTFQALRFLIVFADSWTNLALGVAGVIALRTAIDTLLIRAAWPAGHARPGRRRLLLATAVAAAAHMVLLAPAAMLLFAMGVIPGFWFFAAALPLALAVAVLTPHLPYGLGSWRRLPHREKMAWILLCGIGLSLGGMLIAFTPPALAPLAAAIAGAGDAWWWYAMTHTYAAKHGAHIALPRPVRFHRRQLAITTVGLSVAALVPASVLGTAALTGTAGASQIAPPVPRLKPVIEVGGYQSSLTGRTERRDARIAAHLQTPLTYRHFSYAGLSPAGQPRPYSAQAGDRPLVQLERMLAAQVAVLHRRTHEPVTVIANSEGTLVAKSYLLTHPGAPVDQLILLSPILEPGRVYFPRGATSDGYGLAGGEGARAIAWIVSHLLFHVAADGPIVRSLVDDAGWLRNAMQCPLPRRIEQVELLDLSNAVAFPPPRPSAATMPTIVTPTFHSQLNAFALVQGGIVERLAEHRLAPSPTWQAGETLLRGAAAAWQIPALPLRLNPAWHPRGCPSRG